MERLQVLGRSDTLLLMLKDKIWRQLVPVLIFLALVSLIHWQLKFSLIFFMIGAILGNFLLEIDQIIYCYFQSPQEFNCQRARRLFEQKHWLEGVRLIAETKDERRRLIFHSVLFQIILLLVCFFVLTSSSSFFGKGLVLGLFLHGLLDQLKNFRQEGQFNSWFWQFKSVPNQNIQVFYLVFMFLVFLLFSFFSV